MIPRIVRTSICTDCHLLRGALSLGLKCVRVQLRTGQSRRSISTYQFGFDPHTYTNGRFLRNEKQEIEARYIKFDFDALCQKAIQVTPGANSITTCEKIEVGSNRVFTFTLDNDKRIVARIPFPITGPRKLVTASEVATIQYLQKKTSIPIPNVIDWNDDASNPIGSEYIIMEHADGTPLYQKWPEMAGDQRTRCIGALYEKLGEMEKLEFPAYGNIYFSNNTAADSLIQLPDSAFSIGPNCATRYWDYNEPRYYERAGPNRGPWSTFHAYCDALVDAGFSRVPLENDLKKRPIYHGTIEEHIELLKHARPVVREMASDPRVQKAATPTLFHPYPRMEEIFVSNDDPSVITGIIDWQHAAIEPAFWYSKDIPNFAEITTEPDENKSEHNKEVVCAEAFEACTKYYLPKIGFARSMEENTFRPFRYCHRTWANASGFQHELIELSKDWQVHLGLTGTCPYQTPTAEEQAKHKKTYEFFKEVRKMLGHLEETFRIGPDGWVAPEHYEIIMKFQKDCFNELLRIVRETEDEGPDEPLKNEEDVRAIWPWDV